MIVFFSLSIFCAPAPSRGLSFSFFLFFLGSVTVMNIQLLYQTKLERQSLKQRLGRQGIHKRVGLDMFLFILGRYAPKRNKLDYHNQKAE